MVIMIGPMKSCMKKSTLKESLSDSHRSHLRDILRRASSRRISISDILRSTEATAEISDSSSSRRLSGSSLQMHALWDKLGGSSRRVSHFNVDEKEKKESSVQFSDVSIREYELTASHNPGSAGVPIELGWKYNKLDPVNINEYESYRSTTRSKDFSTEKKLTPVERRRILKQFGCTDREIQEASKRAAILRNRRRRSLELMRHDGLFERVEVIRDGVKNVFGCSGRRSSTCAVAGSGLHPSFWSESMVMQSSI